MKKALAIRHVPFEDLGSFEPIISSKYDIRYLNIAYENIPSSSFDLTIVLGGPIGVYEENLYPFLQNEIDYLKHRLNQNLPTLGICLGSQLIARALGASVYPSGHKEVGWIPLQLTEEGKKSIIQPLENTSMFHFHGDTFDLPDGATLLASTPLCKNQIYSIGKALAFQCHPEVMQPKLEQWWIGHAVELSNLKISPNDLRLETERNCPKLEQIAPFIIKKWIEFL